MFTVVFRAQAQQVRFIQLAVGKTGGVQSRSQGVPTVGRKTEPEFGDNRIGKPAVMKVGKPCLPRRGIQHFVKEPGGKPVRFKHSPALFMKPRVVVVVLRHGKPDFFGKEPHRFDIVKVFNVFNKGNHIAAVAAAETIIRLRFGVNGKGRRFFVVERAKTG